MKLAALPRLALAATVLSGGIFAGARSVGPVPALGAFLDPVTGVWAVAVHAELPAEAVEEIPGLTDSIVVRYDHRRVPHIFASSQEDAARGLGYVVARDRLFQLELQSRVTEGTISELVGRQGLSFDRSQRALGLAWSAEHQWSTLDSLSETFRLASAYAEGVNAWIEQLQPDEIPLEYRLFDARPRLWKPVYTLYLMRQMGYMLAYTRQEQWREHVADAVGDDALEALFPLHSAIQEPIVPVEGAEYPRFDVRRIPPPAVKDEWRRAVTSEDESTDHSSLLVDTRPYSPPLASNNWAVSPSRSATGHAILAGDPHLELTLPSIWYEAHVVVANNAYDAYGVTFAGSPTIIIGFNRYVAWSFTNTGADVADYYEETLDDPKNPTRYLLDGEWHPLASRIEEVRGRHGELLATDTVHRTHRGPLQDWDEGRRVSMRWTTLESTNTGEAISRATRATSVHEWLEAMKGHGAAPQNGLVADRDGSIAIVSAGLYPVRPDDGRGLHVWDGSSSASDWLGFWPSEERPQVLNPPRGFLSSANQEPFDPQANDGYLGADWFPPWRAMHINRLLRENEAVTAEDMQRYQLDPGSARADLFLPALVEAAERLIAVGAADDDLLEARQLLEQWGRLYTRDDTHAVLFESAMSELRRRVWDELGDSLPWPSETALWQLLQDPANPWWDDRATQDHVEDRDEIVGASLRTALEEVQRRYGEPESEEWRWERRRHANIYHLLRLRSLSAVELPVQGGPSTLSPSSGSGVWGASWRMVVELGPEIRARSIYPGGQSGNPLSRYYDDRIARWQEGDLEAVMFPRAPEELDPGMTTATLVLRPETQP